MSYPVSLCMIVRNEEATLAACLRSVDDLVQEIILVDTGSTDRTREIGTELGARVFDFTWVDSFAAARNESIRHATGSWIFWLDGDEQLDEENRQRLRQLFAGLSGPRSAYLMKQRSVSDPATGESVVFEQVRLFPNVPEIRWHYRVHEQVLPDLERLNYAVHISDVVIDHSGYENPSVHRRKQERNLRLLKLQEEENPDDAFTLFNFGLTYNALGKPAEAIPYWQRSLERSQGGGAWTRKLYALMGGAHRQLGRSEDALSVCRAGLSRFPNDLEMLAQEAGLLAERGDLAGAEANLLRVLQAEPRNYFAAGLDVGLQGFKTRHSLATVYRAQNRVADAEAQWRSALRERPDYAPACLGYANLLLSQKRWVEMEEVLRPLEGRLPGRIAAAQLRATKHLSHSELAPARQILEEAVALAPQHLDTLVMLSRVLLREGIDWIAAEKVLRRILEIVPQHTEARNNLTVLLRQLGRAPEPLPSNLAQELFQRAESAFQANDFAEASPIYRSLLHGSFQPGLMMQRLALIANAQNDFKAAWDLHNQAIGTDTALAAKIAPADSPHRGLLCRQRYDVEEVPLCPVCGGLTQTPIAVVNCLAFPHYHAAIHPIRRWVKCSECGHGFANPRPSAAALREAYRDPPPAHLRAWTYDKLTTWSDIVHEMRQRRPGSDFLDIGTAMGGLAGVAQDYGFRVCALDVTPAYAEHVRRLGIEFVAGDLAAVEFGSRRFDVIALGDVIEHVAEPRRALAKIVTWLKPDGLIWLSTPNHEGVWTRSLRERDAMWLESEHLQFFCLRSLSRLAAEYGLAITDYRLSKRFVGCAEVMLEPTISLRTGHPVS